VPDCRKLLAQMSEYIDGELPKDLCASLERHLADCPNCRVMFDSLTKTIKIYREDKEEPLPDELKDKLHKALEARWARKRRA